MVRRFTEPSCLLFRAVPSSTLISAGPFAQLLSADSFDTFSANLQHCPQNLGPRQPLSSRNRRRAPKDTAVLSHRKVQLHLFRRELPHVFTACFSFSISDILSFKTSTFSRTLDLLKSASPLFHVLDCFLQFAVIHACCVSHFNGSVQFDHCKPAFVRALSATDTMPTVSSPKPSEKVYNSLIPTWIFTNFFTYLSTALMSALSCAFHGAFASIPSILPTLLVFLFLLRWWRRRWARPGRSFLQWCSFWRRWSSVPHTQVPN